MADSDEEYDRSRRGRDKFRRERNDYDRHEDRRGRDPWEDRGREAWGGRSRDRRDNYSRDYDRRRDHYSPPRHDISPPQMKRMRHDWDPPYDVPYGGGGGNAGGHGMHGPHRGHGGNWGGGGHAGHQDMGGGGGGNMGPNQGHFGGHQGGGGGMRDVDYPTQTTMMSFKHFLSQQDDNISDADAIKKYNDYKLDFRKQQINEFFLAHKDEEWFKSKYHPEECGRRREDSQAALRKRMQVFMTLYQTQKVPAVTCDLEKSDELTKLLDAAVILMEGGTEFDLKVLDQPEITERQHDEGPRSRNNSESLPTPEKRKIEEEKYRKDEPANQDSPKKKMDNGKTEKPSDKNKDEAVTEEDGAAERKAVDEEEEDEEESEDSEGDSEDEGEEAESGEDVQPEKKKKRHRDRTEHSYESGSDSDSLSDSESEPVPPGTDHGEGEATPNVAGFDGANDDRQTDTSVGRPIPQYDGPEDEEEAPEEGEADGEIVESSKEENDKEEKEMDTIEKEEVDPKPKALHRTCSIFLRNLAPSITKQEVEAMCKRYPGFMRVALQDPQPERRFFRRGWVTFDRSVNIKDICWNLNNIRLRECEMGAIVNRELKQRVRPVNGITAHKQVIKADIKHAAKIVQNLDTKWGLWEDTEDEKKDEEKQPSFGLVSKNPVLKNITDYLVEEGSYEEEELLGESIEEKTKETNPEIQIERDETLQKVLDRMILYLRIVHSFDYYSAIEYPNEDEMPHRCGIMHARGPNPPNRLTQNDVNEWIKTFGNKIGQFTELTVKLGEEEAMQLGKKDPEAEVEKFVVLNTQELSKDKWLCPLSGKKFKGPEFIRKHIFNKHAEKVEEVKEEVAFFNNYLLDPKRPQLPPHPGNKPGGPMNQYNMQQGGASGFQGPPQQGMMGYNQPRPPMMHQGRYGNDRSFGRSGNFSSPQYGRPDHYRHDNRRRDSYPPRMGRDRYRPDPRGIIEYRDLDAPDDMDMF